MTDTTEYVSVPREPTEEMFEGWRSVCCKTDGEFTLFHGDYGNWLSCHQAMLAAAPPPPSPWKDIEGAPKDGTFRALIRGGTYAMVRDISRPDEWTPFHEAVLAVRNVDGTWLDMRGYAFVYRPTHYMLMADLLAMPLPTPPTDGGK